MRLISIFSFLLFSAVAGVSPVFAADSALDEARQSIAERFKGIPETSIQSSPIKGLYAVSMPPRLFYVSADAKYIIDGDVIDLAMNENMSQPLRSKVRMDAIESLGEDSMIVFSPEKVKHTITVFTDIDCGYCRKLHNEMAEYNKHGIEVRYLAFPRSGIDSESYNKAVSVWCSRDRKAAMTKAKNNESIPDKSCDNPVAEQYKLGTMMGIRGTPALVLENGQIVSGYVPAARLITALDNKNPH
ncbi:MAG: thioredoxin fold domain-containing protein [Gammaproteobacteria bacterium]|nr:thioredoxin fold domain-containing protein [Gammaproteobacteria bacterium]